jgi:dienelactone hydrolase
MTKVIVSDIFGITPALQDLAEAVGSVTAAIDPYGGKEMGFGTESLAYEHFMTHVGIPAYEQQVAACLAEIPNIDLLIGFSVGAAAVWGISGTLSPEQIARAVCFYGSRIRHAADIIPRIPMVHILPRKEPGFDIDDLAATLSHKPAVTVHKTPFLHGFMNRVSPNFSRTGYDAWVDRLRRNRL